MKKTGVIAEYNPFHSGHAFLLSQIRKARPDTLLITAMSGDFIQRGGPALLGKHERARMALLGGADLVLELPLAASCASAEGFARAGVSILSALGCDSLSFGIEPLPGLSMPAKEALMVLARQLLAEPPAYRELLRALMKEGLSFPAARARAAAAIFPGEGPLSAGEIQSLLSSPNLILALEYAKALIHEQSPMILLPVERLGSGYHDRALPLEGPASASSLRERLLSGSMPDGRFFPAGGEQIIREAFLSKSLMGDDDLDEVLYYHLLSSREETLSRAPDLSEAMARRIKALLPSYRGFASFALSVKSRDITLTRARRALIQSLLALEKGEAVPLKGRVLGVRKSALPRLFSDGEGENLITRPGHAQRSGLLSPAEQRSLQKSAFASDLYEGLRSRKSLQPFVLDLQRKLIVLS